MNDAATTQPLSIFWDVPVLASGRLIFGPLEADFFMRTKWSDDKNADFAAAARSIMKALDGRASPDHARELFQRAIATARLN